MFLPVLLFLSLTGCVGPKYIPATYFLSKHDMRIKIRPLPDPVFIEEDQRSNNSLLSAAVGAAVNSGRRSDLRKAFEHVDIDEMRDTLEAHLTQKIKDYYNVKTDSQDMLTEVVITSWGWLLPTGSFGIKLGAYKLQMSGRILVYDESMGRKEIGKIYLTTNEEMKDNMSKTETDRRIKRALEEFADLCAEFLWKSDDK